MNFFGSLSDYVFSSDSDRMPISQQEVQSLADSVSPAVIEYIDKGTSTADMQAIRQYRRDTGASLDVAYRVFKELKWRTSISQNKNTN